MAVEFKIPNLGDNIDSIRVVSVLVKPGDEVEIDQPVLELETDKATIDVPIDVAGKVAEIRVAPGEEIAQGAVVLTLESDEQVETPAVEAAPEPEVESIPPSVKAEPPAPVEPDERITAPESVTLSPGSTVPASPKVRRFARQIGIDIDKVSGSGPDGRVSEEDVKAYARTASEERPVMQAPQTAASPLPDFGKWGEVERHKMSLIRKLTAQGMAQSWSHVPHVTIYDSVDITDLEDLRLEYAHRAEQEGGKLSMAVMVCKVVAHALKQFPQFNASIDMVTEEIIYKKYINLGIAVHTPRGLMVPVVRDAHKKNMVELSVEILQLAQKVRTGKISVDEMEGGTFTVSNLGRVGGTYFTPIVNYPEVAILGMGRTYEDLDLVDGEVEERVILPLSLSFDHRAIDGADGAAFLKWIIDAIRQPLVLALEG